MSPSASRLFFHGERVSIDKERGRQRAFHFSRSAQVPLPCFPGRALRSGTCLPIPSAPLGIASGPPLLSIAIFHRMESLQGSLYFCHSPVTPSSLSIPFLDPTPVWSSQVKPLPDPCIRRPPHARHSSKPRWVDGLILAQHGSAHVNALDESQHHRLGHSSRFWLGDINRVIQLNHPSAHPTKWASHIPCIRSPPRSP